MKISEAVNLKTVIIFAVIAFFAGVIVMSQRLNREIDYVIEEISREQKEQIEQDISVGTLEEDMKSNVTSRQKVTRKTRRDPRGGAYLESIFFKGGEVVARYKESKGEIYDREGSIPDGKVEFLDEDTKIKGEEFYQKGKRHGTYREFYKTGQLKKEVEFYRGKVITSKEYYLNGTVRMEQEFKNALWDAFDPENAKQGSGRLYYPLGTVDREWDYEGGENGERYLKIYDKNGALRSVEYYDEEGNLVENE